MTVFRRWRKDDPEHVASRGTAEGPFMSIDPGAFGVTLFFDDIRDWPAKPTHIVPLEGDLVGVAVAAELAKERGVRVCLCEQPFAAKPKVRAGKKLGTINTGVTIGMRAGLVLGAVIQACGVQLRDVITVLPPTWQSRQKRCPYLPETPSDWSKRSTKERSRAIFDHLFPALLDERVRRKPFREASADAWGLADWYAVLKESQCELSSFSSSSSSSPRRARK